MNNRLRSKLILLMLFIPTSCMSFFIQSVYGAEILGENLEINSSWFRVTATDYNGNPLTAGKYDRLNIDVGGVGMSNFIDHGLVGHDSATDTFVYMAEMTFPFYAVAYTDTMITDIFDYQYEEVKEYWLRLKTFKYWVNGDYQGSIRNDEYYVEYDNIKINSIDTQEYDGPITINTEFIPNIPISAGSTVEINGATFSVPDIQAYTSKVKLIDRSYGVCDDPQNFYTSQMEGSIIPTEHKSILDLFGLDNIAKVGRDDAKSACNDGWNDNFAVPYGGTTAKDKIDAAGLKNRVIKQGITYTTTDIGQGFMSSPTVGAEYSNKDSSSSSFDYQFNMRIKPNAFYDMEEFDIKKKTLLVDRHIEDVLPEYGLCDAQNEHTDHYTRIIGLGVQNLFMKLKFEATTVVLLSVQPTGKESSAVMGDPETYQSEILWDNTIRGTTEAEVSVLNPRSWWDDWVDGWNGFWNGLGTGLGGWWDSLMNAIGDFFEDPLGWLVENWVWIALIGVVIVVAFAIYSYIRNPRRAQEAFTVIKEETGKITSRKQKKSKHR